MSEILYGRCECGTPLPFDGAPCCQSCMDGLCADISDLSPLAWGDQLSHLQEEDKVSIQTILLEDNAKATQEAVVVLACRLDSALAELTRLRAEHDSLVEGLRGLERVKLSDTGISSGIKEWICAADLERVLK